MRRHKIKGLLERGWSTSELARSLRILERANENDIRSHRVVYWSVILICTIGNLLLSATLVVLSVLVEVWVFYVAVATAAIVAGVIYTYLIEQVNHLSERHHLIAMMLIAAVAAVTIIGVAAMVGKMAVFEGVVGGYGKVIVGVEFGVIFLVPTILKKIYHKWKFTKKT